VIFFKNHHSKKDTASAKENPFQIPQKTRMSMLCYNSSFSVVISGIWSSEARLQDLDKGGDCRSLKHNGDHRLDQYRPCATAFSAALERRVNESLSQSQCIHFQVVVYVGIARGY
jgi:hypothetical protein